MDLLYIVALFGEGIPDVEGFRWGPGVRWCLALGGTDFCYFCVYVNRLLFKMLGRNPTFIGFNRRIE